MMSDIIDAEISPSRAYLLRVLDALQIDATNLARRAGLAPSTLTRFLSDNARSETLRRATLEAIARASKVPLPPELAAPAGSPSSPDTQAGMRDVPVQALISAPSEGLFYWNQTSIDFAPRLPGIRHNTKVFAIRAPDDTMSGWRRPGELIYIDPTRAVSEGDHTLAEIANRASPNNPSLYFVRRLDRRRGNEVVFGTWGFDPSEQTFPRRDVLSLLRVLEWPELLGA